MDFDGFDAFAAITNLSCLTCARCISPHLFFSLTAKCIWWVSTKYKEKTYFNRAYMIKLDFLPKMASIKVLRHKRWACPSMSLSRNQCNCQNQILIASLKKIIFKILGPNFCLAWSIMFPNQDFEKTCKTRKKLICTLEEFPFLLFKISANETERVCIHTPVLDNFK